jgi:hypothetical protein
MSAIAPFAASSFAPEERPQQAPARSPATAPGGTSRSGRRRPASPPAGPCSGSPWPPGWPRAPNYLEQDPELALLAGAQVGSVAAGMAVAGARVERRRMTRIARAAAGPATRLTADGTPADEAADRLLAPRGADRVALQQAARDTAGSPDGGRALGLLGRVAVLRALP